ncbi:MAG: hypothetical protein CFH01_01568 [Alphaproteobacteria bacterium MarineAlpha2_Bin1]|nr:MAG: hypothetical protein CFH01_01568 [Alphaproteobacteria bacterium MarineAlpha2_Bin1]|tara:strand:- start:1730 stop:2407 length:678 start_codon:yes stop_codon:yes gene_type:complete
MNRIKSFFLKKYKWLLFFIFNKVKLTKIMAKNMREPKDFFFAYIAKRVMLISNKKMIYDCVERLSVSKEDTVLEIGSGSGQALNEIIKRKPKKVYAIEISKVFRKELKLNFKEQNFDIIDIDAKNLSKIIKSGTIDKLLLINVIYFLHPLEIYLKEFKKILHQDGTILISGRFKAIESFDKKIFKNSDIDYLIDILSKYFNVKCDFIDLGTESSKYHSIKLKNLS